MSEGKTNKSKVIKNKYLVLLIFLIVFAFLGMEYVLAESNGDSGTDAVLTTAWGLLKFTYNFFVVLLIITYVFIPAVLISVKVFRKKLLGLPDETYQYYKQHLKHGKLLIRSGKKEKFDQDTPVPESITAKKFARLFYHTETEKLNFRPMVYSSRTYGLSEDAVCYKHRKKKTHTPPGDKCRCGFYGLRSFDELLAAYNNPLGLISRVVLTCSMYGKIAEASNGFRAARQEVLSIEFLKYCFVCAKDNPSETIVANRIATLIHPASIDDNVPNESLLIPICSRHNKVIERAWSLQDIRDQLRVDVDWYEITPL